MGAKILSGRVENKAHFQCPVKATRRLKFAAIYKIGHLAHSSGHAVTEFQADPTVHFDTLPIAVKAVFQNPFQEEPCTTYRLLKTKMRFWG